MLGGDPDKIYLITSDLQSPSGSGLDFISMSRAPSICLPSCLFPGLPTDGFGWLQRFYTVYDTTNARVGIARTTFTDAQTN